MAKYIKLVIVLSLISAVSGGILGPLKAFTEPKAQALIFKYKKIPGVIGISVADPGKLSQQDREKLESEIMADKRELTIQGKDEPAIVYVLKKDGKPSIVVLESAGRGYAGDIGVMVGFSLDTGDLEGIGITTMSETPGVGTQVKNQFFTEQFKGMKKDSIFKIKKDGGSIDGISGASFSCRGVSAAIQSAKDFYTQHHDEIVKLVNP